jgi:3-oxoacyl-[acyl-carrier-protein] synthase-3
MAACVYKWGERMKERLVGIVGIGTYLPNQYLTAEEISKRTKGQWEASAVKEKLGIIRKTIPGPEDGTQTMGVKAAKEALLNADISAESIDVILCMGEEWKEYPLTTSALYIQDKIGAINAWGIDLQNRCCTTVTAIKMAKDMIISDETIKRIMIVGGYRNGDFVDYEDPNMSMMFNLSAGAGALILEGDVSKNKVLGSHIIADGSLSRDAGVAIGGINNPITEENLDQAYQSLKLFNPKKMKNRLKEVSLNNWFTCIDEALKKSNLTRDDIDYLGVLHFKRSMHEWLLQALNLSSEQSIYLEEYGHMGQVDQILSLELALKDSKVKAGDNVLLLAAGIGYVWAANVIEWGEK